MGPTVAEEQGTISSQPKPAGGVVRTGELAVILVVVLGLGALAAILYGRKTGVVSTARGAAIKTQCLSNIKQLSTGAMIYLTDYDDHNFLPGSIKTPLMPYIKNASIFECPLTHWAFGTNDKLRKLDFGKIKDPSKTVFFFDSGGVSQTFPHDGLGAVSFADTHAKMIKAGTPLHFDP